MIEFVYFFHTTHTGNDHLFFSGKVHTIAVEVQDYEVLTEKNFICKIVNILIASEKPLDYINERFPKYFNSNHEHIPLYRNRCTAKKQFDAKFKLHMNNYDCIVTFSQNELNLLLNDCEERLPKKREHNKLKRSYNEDLTLKDRFHNNDRGLKKFKRDTSDDNDEDEKEGVAVAQKIDECIDRYSLVPTFLQLLLLETSSLLILILRT
jgi:hypothetical protein